jgi:ABC-type nickel/cobalt efflux system permease component RcnA
VIRLPFAAALAMLVSALLPGLASAHPLGNFTVNHYARIEPGADQIRLVYVLDMAEIPTFQEQPRITSDPAAYAAQRAAEIGQNLHLTIDGVVATARLDHQELSFLPGAGGLSTLRLEATYIADTSGLGLNADTAINLELRDDNDPNRIGWREIVARTAADGATIQQSSVPAQDVTDELRQYPEELLSSPLNVRQASLSYLPGAASTSGIARLVPAVAAATAAQPMFSLPGTNVLDRTRSTLADLANGGELTPSFILFAIGVAIVLGMAHALQPGHGKTVVAAYLVGSRGTARHALFLGATVTSTHTAGVYALGLVTLGLSQYILPERLYPVLEVGSGLLVVGIGVWLFGRRLLAAVGFLPRPGGHEHHHHDDHGHDHAHEHAHAHEHTHGDALTHTHGGSTHSHTPPERVTWKALLALGISGGLLPCPEALMVLLITIAAHRVLFGLLLIVSFSTGLAAVLVGFGLMLVYARGWFSRVNLSSGFVPRVLPVISALVIVVAGGVITVQALPLVL